MKNIILPFLFALLVHPTMAQLECQAYFSSYSDSTGLTMVDGSFNVDSTQINVVSWDWTLQGMGMSYTYTQQNPFQAAAGLPSGSYLLCLTITTATSCTSTYCDSVYFGPQTGCQANFSYNNNGSTFYFTDESFTTGGGSIVSWNWTFNGGSPSTSTLQNPVVDYLNPMTTYQATLTIVTDDGCSDSYTGNVYYYDSTNCITWVDVTMYPVTTPGGSDGAVDITVYGGGGPYAYTWSNGSTSEDIYNVPSGNYSATIWPTDSMCQPYTLTAYIPEPYDSGNVFLDTLYTPALDSCLTFIPDSFYISGISTNGNIVSVTWIFTGSGQMATFTVDYTFGGYGNYLVVLSINCTNAKTTNSYMSYIYVHGSVGMGENDQQMQIYPNPASDVIQIPTGLNALRVIAMDGQLMLEVEHPTTSINISNIPEGMYIILGESDNGYNSTRLQVIR